MSNKKYLFSLLLFFVTSVCFGAQDEIGDVNNKREIRARLISVESGDNFDKWELTRTKIRLLQGIAERQETSMNKIILVRKFLDFFRSLKR